MENHPIQKLKDKHIEPGCDLRDDYSGWNISTTIDKKVVKNNLGELDFRAAITTANFRNKHIGSDYLNPESEVNKLNILLRGEKL